MERLALIYGNMVIGTTVIFDDGIGVDEALALFGYDPDDTAACEAAYEEMLPGAYLDDNFVPYIETYGYRVEIWGANFDPESAGYTFW